MKRPVIVITVVAALGAATVQAWSDVRQARAFRRLLAEGDAALGRGETSAAIEAFSGAVVLRPQSMLPYLKRGDTYRRQGQLDSAERDLTQAQALDPTAPQPLELAGDVRMTRGDAAGAVTPYRAYLALDDRAPRLQYKLGLALYRSGDPAAAADAARHALALDPNLAEAHQLLGVAALAQGRTDEAAAALTRALKLQPASDATRATLVDLYAAQERTRDETAQREALATLDAARPEGLVSLALAQLRHGRSDAAVATLARAAERFPGSPVVANATGRLWLDLAETTGDSPAIQQAIGVLAPAAARENASSETLALYGRALLLNGDLKPAQATLLRATTRFPIERNAFLQLSAAEARLGHREAARVALARHAALTEH
ncbi:MAG TPA: tetratricopeptide repeat protein [Vicinamibacterales bacterium]|nr:tetratricopeptide repeat protein [Vicinamibacterales bacterium]